MPDLRLLRILLRRSWLLCGLLTAEILFAETRTTISGAYGSYEDAAIRVQGTRGAVRGEFSLTEDPNIATTIDANTTQQKLTKSDSPEGEKLNLDGEDQLTMYQGGLQLSQNLNLQQSLSLLFDTTKSQASTSRSLGIGYQQWLGQDRFRLSLSFRRNSASKPVNDFTDVDGKRVITPDTIEGSNVGVSLMAYATPTLIILADHSYTRQSDRPAAWSGNVEFRQYVNTLNGSLHGSAGHYENVGRIKPVTTYGGVIANTAGAEWHQKMFSQYILMGGYQFYLEHENPRGDTTKKTYGSDYVYTTFRYRQNKSWTYRSTEFSATAGHYIQNSGLRGNLIALGFDWLIN